MEDIKKGQYYFPIDLITGQEGEKIVQEFYKKNGYSITSECNDNKFDFIMQGKDRKPIAIEVKTDSFKDKKTDEPSKNIAIEVESRGKDSGLTVTEAEYFVTLFRLTGGQWVIKSDSLRKLISENNFYLHNGGDKGSNTKFHLINKNNFKKHFQVHQLYKI